MGRKDMKKKAAMAGVKAELAKKGPAPNPFEMKTNRRKHQVVDNRQKKNQFNVAQSRSRADELRKQSLMVEFAQQHKANSFSDRRFGALLSTRRLDLLPSRRPLRPTRLHVAQVRTTAICPRRTRC